MIGWLVSIFNAVAAFGQLVLWGVVSAFNLVTAAIGAALAAALALLPGMSEGATFGEPTWLKWLNWFYPVGLLLAGLVTAVALWTAFLVVRYVLKLVRAL